MKTIDDISKEELIAVIDNMFSTIKKENKTDVFDQNKRIVTIVGKMCELETVKNEDCKLPKI